MHTHLALMIILSITNTKLDIPSPYRLLIESTWPLLSLHA